MINNYKFCTHLKPLTVSKIPCDALKLVTNMVKQGYSDGRIIPSTKLTSLLYYGVNQLKTLCDKDQQGCRMHRNFVTILWYQK